MKILLAKTAGFCMGVRRAVEMALDAPNKHENPIYTYGPLIHNPHVLNLLKEKGISVIDDMPDHGSGTVLIRAHGVPPQAKEKLKKAGFTIIDATCPRVIKVQTIINKHARQSYTSIIIGDKDHPEVRGLLGYSDGKGYVVDNINDLDSLPAFEKAIIVAQTTQNIEFFEEIKKWANKKFPHYKIFNTICDSTSKRQAEVKRLSGSVDAVIVVGGHNSGNTQRLAEIAKESGKPSYHIESENELDLKALASAKNIGLTAGASTPNWITKRVYRSLESLFFKKEQRWRKAFFSIQRSLLLTNIYVSLGAGCLCYACTRLQAIEHHFPHVLISILYVLSMHILNNMTGSKADQYNDPERALFYRKHKVFLAALAVIAGSAGLIAAYLMGITSFLILFLMSLLGLSYNIRLLPESLFGGRYRRIRDIPGSKTVLIAAAWGIVTSIFPTLSASESISVSTIIVFFLSACMVFVRTAFFDTLDMQGDRIVGRATIPILLGEKRTMRLLKIMLTVILATLLLSSAFQFISTLGFLLALCPVFIFVILSAYERGYMLPGIRLEFLVETHFVLAGIITIIWSVVSQ
ncbi:MAG: 4-hydroxy-3-methylbut-2-enyl diphosphate reductase [Deltaproteobacteria bacterium]|jgi:4-hydroxy-3-methylbut-2-enyl diphosphate reductase|nr:4-hydroxy-3-methylbut-2-enyl diphosphate reductase [Deltaproteobacteria bacterium]MDL1987957.1 4-hydroxy-3-methylbut-2-enyl diphosphate reductase [Deltaproteobacteria bacterium]MDL2123504.1 4-hydroxy-3-methylbut-2-enyl diphosphate reductase [Deltaproteobacteria bacterium]